MIADICRDLGIIPSHPLWRELQLVIIGHGGSLARLLSDFWDRVHSRLTLAPVAHARDHLAGAEAQSGTGPPPPL